MNEINLFLGKKCVSCGQFFVPDRRIGERQKCCSAPGCQKKRKRIQEKAWRSQYPDYFKGLFYESYVKPWRAAHPGYQKAWRAKKRLRDKVAHEIKTQIPTVSPMQSIRLNLRVPLRLGEIKTQFLKVTQVGQAFWVDGA